MPKENKEKPHITELEKRIAETKAQIEDERRQRLAAEENTRKINEEINQLQLRFKELMKEDERLKKEMNQFNLPLPKNYLLLQSKTQQLMEKLQELDDTKQSDKPSPLSPNKVFLK